MYYFIFRSEPIYAVVDKTKKRNSRLFEMENTLLNKTENECSSPSNIGAVLLAACPEESGTNSSALTTSATGSAGECSTSGASASSADNNNSVTTHARTISQRIPNLQTVASLPMSQQSQDASNNVNNSQITTEVITNPQNFKEVTVASSSVMFVSNPPKNCEYFLFFYS